MFVEEILSEEVKSSLDFGLKFSAFGLHKFAMQTNVVRVGFSMEIVVKFQPNIFSTFQMKISTRVVLISVNSAVKTPLGIHAMTFAIIWETSWHCVGKRIVSWTQLNFWHTKWQGRKKAIYADMEKKKEEKYVSCFFLEIEKYRDFFLPMRIVAWSVTQGFLLLIWCFYIEKKN